MNSFWYLVYSNLVHKSSHLVSDCLYFNQLLMMNFFKPEPDNIVGVTYQLLQEIKVNVNIETLSKMLKNHHDYPSLLAISDSLKELKVCHQVYVIEKSAYQMSDLSFPFIAFIPSGDWDFVLVYQQEDHSIGFSDGIDKNLILSEDEFFQSWEGIALYAQYSVRSGEPNYVDHLIYRSIQRILFPFFILTLLSCITLIWSFNAQSGYIFTLGVLKFTGGITTVLLLLQQLNHSHPLIARLCVTSQKDSCQTILNSAGARLTSWLSWTELGFFYFVGSFLVILFLPALWPLLKWINWIALPFTIYSFWYQFKLKHWCSLCSIVQVLLVLECLIFNLIASTSALFLNPVSITAFLVCYSLPVSIWGLLRPTLVKAEHTEVLKKKLDEYQHDIELFSLSLSTQTHYEINSRLMPIALGKPTAKTVITLVINPYCASCKDAYFYMVAWLEQRNDLLLQIIFAHAAEENSAQSKIAQQMIALSQQQDKNIVTDAMADWFKQPFKDYGAWAKKHPILIGKAVKAARANQQKWAERANINYTPAVLINGYKLPARYQLSDLKYLLH